MSTIDETEIEQRVAELHRSPVQACLACTGAGAGLQELLWSVPGSSSTLLEATLPYARESFAEYTGGMIPQRYCSEEAAVMLAAAAYERAQRLIVKQGGSPDHAAGLGLAAALVTLAERKRPDQVYVAIRTAQGFRVATLAFKQGALGRVGEGRACDIAALNMLLAAAGIAPVRMSEEMVAAVATDLSSPIADGVVVTSGLKSLHETTGLESPVGHVFWPDGSFESTDSIDEKRHLLFAGSYNPLHYGHSFVAEQGEAMTGLQAVFNVTATHPDKGAIPVDELWRRAEQFRYRAPIMFTANDGLYLEKSRHFPGVMQIIGADAALGLLDPKYYGGVEGRDAALDEMIRNRTTFLVAGRMVKGEYLASNSLPVPLKYATLFRPLSGRCDMSSTELRARQRS